MLVVLLSEGAPLRNQSNLPSLGVEAITEQTAQLILSMIIQLQRGHIQLQNITPIMMVSKACQLVKELHDFLGV